MSEADAVVDVAGDDWSVFEHPRLSAIAERSATFARGRRVIVSIADCMLAYFIGSVLCHVCAVVRTGSGRPDSPRIGQTMVCALGLNACETKGWRKDRRSYNAGSAQGGLPKLPPRLSDDHHH